MDKYEETVVQMREQLRDINTKLGRVEKNYESIMKFSADIKLLLREQELMNAFLHSIDERVTKIEEQPAEKYKLIVHTFLSTIVAAIAGGLFTAIVGGIL